MAERMYPAVVGIGHAVPGEGGMGGRTLSNAEFFAEMRGSSDPKVARIWERMHPEAFVEVTDIEARHLADLEKEPRAAIALAAEATRRALATAGITVDQLCAIHNGTSINGINAPATAAIVPGVLGLRGPSFMDTSDIYSGCSGQVEALQRAMQATRDTGYPAVAGGVDICSLAFNLTDPKVTALFGDGASAMVTALTPGAIEPQYAAVVVPNIDILNLAIDGSRRNMLRMTGGAVKEMARELVPMVVAEAARKAGWTDANGKVLWDEHDIVLAPHQANGKMLAEIAAMMNVPPARALLDSVRQDGNTAAASIGLGLCRAHQKRRLPVGRLQNVMFVGTGAGFSAKALAASLLLKQPFRES